MKRAQPILHPVALLAIALLIANDHWWKAAYPSWWTGKLSDFAGLTFFPLLLAAALEVVRVPRERAVVLGAAATALVFALVKSWPPATEAYRYGLGFLQSGAWHPVSAVTDPTDLFALPCVVIAVVLAREPAPPRIQPITA